MQCFMVKGRFVKNYASRILKIIALVMVVFPISYLIFAVTLFNVSATKCLGLYLSPAFLVMNVLGIVSGIGFWKMRRWAWYTFCTSQLIVIYANVLLAFHYGESRYRILSFVFSLVIVWIFYNRAEREIRVPYFLPKIRWWESNPRYRLSIPVELERKNGNRLQGEVLDLSAKGCFVKLRQDLTMDERISMDLRAFGVNLECQGTVVWRADSAVTHPKGIGIKFDRLTRTQRQVLRAMTQRIEKMGDVYRSYRYLLSQEEFNRRYEEMKKGKLKVSEAEVHEAEGSA